MHTFHGKMTYRSVHLETAALPTISAKTILVIDDDARAVRALRHLERRAPHLCPRVLFLTGDTLAPEVTPFFQQVAAPYLMKPFNATELRHAIRHAVQAAGR